MKRHISIVLLLSMLASLTACGGDAGTPSETTSPTADTGTTVADSDEISYEFDRTFGGEEFHILNCKDVYSMHAQLDREEQTGDPLDDAMYERCRMLEELLEIKIVEDATYHCDDSLAAQGQKIILAGEDVFDIMYVPARDTYKFTSEGMLNNLLDYDEIQLDQPWWLQSYNDPSTLGGKLYTAAGYSHLMVVDSIWCLFFNEDMMADLNLEKPYDLVREGKWTIDEYGKYVKAGTALNGDDSFAFTDGGKAVYGSSGAGFSKYLIAFGEMMIENQNDKLTMTCENESFYNAVDKLLSVLSIADGTCYNTLSGAVDGTPGSYITMFEIERALFLTAELSKTNRMRDKDFSFGIVPYPKLDEKQEQYYTSPFYATPGLAVPITNPNPEDALYIADALTYLSWRDVWPIFREVTLEQKGLRNDDSIEMLDIIIQASVPDMIYCYGIGSAMRTEVENKMKAGDAAVASVIASHKSSVMAELDKINK